MYVDLRQQNVPNRSHIKIVLRAAAGQAGCAKVPQLTTVGASTCVEPAVSKCDCCQLRLFEKLFFVQGTVPPVVSQGSQMHLGVSNSRQLELKPPAVQVCIKNRWCLHTDKCGHLWNVHA